jgi:hypothetical protein
MDIKWMIFIVLDKWWFKLLYFKTFDILKIVNIDEKENI